MIDNEELFNKCLENTILTLQRYIDISIDYGMDYKELDRIKKILDSKDNKRILELIDEEPDFFYDYTMSIWMFKNEDYQDNIYQIIVNKEYDALGKLLMYVPLSNIIKIEKFKKWFDSLNENEYDDFIYSQMYCIIYDEYLYDFIKKLNNKNSLFSMLHYEKVKEFIYTDDDLTTTLINNYFEDLKEKDYIYLWDNHKEKLLNVSLENKLLMMKSIHDKKIQQEIFKKFNIISHLNNIDDKFNFLISFVDDDDVLIKILIDKFIENPFLFGYDIDVGKLNENIQKSVFTNERLKEHYYFRNINFIKNIHPNVLDIIIKENKVIDEVILYNLYLETKNEKYLNILIYNINNRENVNIDDKWLYTDLYNMFSIDLIDKILNMINFPSNEEELNVFFSMNINLDNPFYKRTKDNAIEFISNQKELNVIIANTEIDILKILNNQEFEMLFNKIPKSNQLINITFNERFLLYVFKILKKDKNYFNDVLPLKLFILGFQYDVKKYIKEIEYIFCCLNLDEQKEIFYNYTCMNNSALLKEYYINYVLKNCEKITSIYTEFFTDEQLLFIAERCNFELLDKIKYSLQGKYDFNQRVEDLIDFINKGNYVSKSLLNLFTFSNIEKVLMTADINNVFSTILDLKSFYPIVFERLKKETLNLDNYDSLQNCRKFFVKLTDDEMISLLKSISSENLITLNNFLNESNFENEIISRIKDNKLILGTYDTTRILLNNFNKENFDYINNTVESEFNNIDKFFELKNKLKDKDLKEKMVLNYIIKSGYLNDEKYEILLNMYNRDPFLFYSFDSRLLRDDIFKLGEYFISKTSRYPNVAKKVIDIFDNNPKLGNLLVEMSKSLTKCEQSKDIYDKKMEMIINYLLIHRDTFEGIDFFDIKLLNNIEAYILQHYIMESNNNDLILDKEHECDISNYNNDRKRYLDNKARNSKCIDDLRNILYNRFFWLDSNRIKEFIRCYVTNYSDVVEYAVSDLPINYLKIIMKIESINDFSTLLDFYENMDQEFTISDYMTIIGIMSNAYNKANSEVLKKAINSTKVEKEIVINGKKEKYQVYEMYDNFGIFVHSTCAYGEMPLINNDYFDSWNYNSNTENHGICSCYITNSSYGIPPVEGNGVLFGITNINEHSVLTMAPYDLVTVNNGYTISSKKPPLYMRLDKVPDFTRHTHNEFDIERRNTTIENKLPCIQPNCVIIFEEMSDKIKANSIKAVEDFKKHGVHLDIIYISRTKVIQNEANKIDKSLNIYEQTYNLDLLSEIINRYESNRCGCKFIEDIKQKDLFHGSRIYELLHNTIDYLVNISDESYKRSQISKFINILDSEQAKFDIIIELNDDRANKFDLYDNRLKEKVNSLKQILYQEYNNEKVII